MEKVNHRVLILGATGMLGHVVHAYLEKNSDYELFNLVYRNKLNEKSILCDVTNKAELERILLEFKPSIVINCIGVLIKESQSDPSRAIYINAYLPHSLVQVCNRIQAKLIHVSTDCVFSGKSGGYSELDFRDADDVYGRSKSLGEVIISPHLTLRTSIIGPEIKAQGEGLFHWFMRQEGVINGYTKAFWGGVTTLELSKAILKSIQEELTGLYHVTNGTRISKFDLLSIINQKLPKKKVEIHPVYGKEVDKSLVTSKEVDFRVPSYSQMTDEMIKEILANESMYKENYNIY